jgi:hypothetical protein
MVADVQNWLNNPATNFGWALLGNEAQGQTAKRFNSGEDGNTLYTPTLSITYTAVPEPGVFGLLAVAALGFVIRRRTR